MKDLLLEAKIAITDSLYECVDPVELSMAYHELSKHLEDSLKAFMDQLIENRK